MLRTVVLDFKITQKLFSIPLTELTKTGIRFIIYFYLLIWVDPPYALKLVLVYAVLGCVWMLLAYAAFSSVVMVTGRGGSCGDPTAAYSRFWLGSELGESCGRSTTSNVSVGMFFILEI